MADRLKIPLFDAKPPREPREERIATAVSLFFHMLVLLLFIGWGGRAAVDVMAAELGVGDGIGAGLAGGGGGGGSDDDPIAVTPVDAPPEAPKVEEKPVEPIPEPVPVPEPEIKPDPPVAVAAPDTTPKNTTATQNGSGTSTGGGTGSGTGAGTGPGSGGGSGGGDGGGIGSGTGPGSGRGKMLAPSPEVLLIPPPAPGSVRGKTVVVRLAVDAEGLVKDAEVIPTTGDKKYDSALKRVALGWRFRAARDAENKSVAVLFDVTFTF